MPCITSNSLRYDKEIVNKLNRKYSPNGSFFFRESRSFLQNSRWASPGHGLDHVHGSIDRWILSLGIRALDKLIDASKEAEASQPPSQTFA
jgi:hypothetical protein